MAPRTARVSWRTHSVMSWDAEQGRNWLVSMPRSFNMPRVKASMTACMS